LCIKVRSSAFAKNAVDKAHVGPEGVFDQYGYKISLAHLLNWLRSSGCKVWLGRVRSLIEQLENRQKFPSGEIRELTQGEEEEREKKQSAATGTKQVTPTTLTLRPAAAASAAAAADREEEGERKRKKKRKDTSDTE
jgi:hypothetical protein